jgi:hypothetical protein
LDKQFRIILVRYNNSSIKYQETVDIEIAAFLDKYDLYKDIRKYCIKYKEPASILNYILLYRRLEAILVPILLFIQLDLQRIYNLAKFKKDIELLIEY